MVRVLGERSLVEDLVGGALHVVVDAVAALVGDDVLLAGDLRLAQDEPCHAIRLELHDEPEPVLGDGLVVVGPVEPGRRVALRARFLELAIERARLEVLGLVEHQVLEEVREPRLPRLLVP